MPTTNKNARHGVRDFCRRRRHGVGREPPGGCPGGHGHRDRGGPSDPSGFGPGTFLAPRILEAADANKDGRLSPEEAANGAARFVREADTSKKGSLDQGTLAEAINQHIGPPPGSGPGGPMGQERKLFKQFHKDADDRLDQQERQTRRS